MLALVFDAVIPNGGPTAGVRDVYKYKYNIQQNKKLVKVILHQANSTYKLSCGPLTD